MLVRRVLLALSLLALLPSLTAQIVLSHFDLTEEGQPDSTSVAVEIPSMVQRDLLRQRMIPHPFVGTNEDSVQWVSDREWVYRTTFELPSEELSGYRLRLRWVDTFAEVYLNGALLGRTENLFRIYTYNLDGHLRTGTNRLVIRLLSPTKIGQLLYESNGFNYPADNDRAVIFYSPYIRTAPYHYGWDWAPRLISMGLFAPPVVERSERLHPEDFYVRSKIEWSGTEATSATLTVSGSRRARGASLTLLDPDGVELEQAVLTGDSVSFAIPEPRLWMPNGWGKVERYTLVYQDATGARGSLRVGLREVHLDQTDGAFRFVVNRRPFYAKGANYLPHDRRMGDHGRSLERFFVEDVLPAHFNMLRVWGGGIYETEEFYELADRYGILIWQDFPFACTTYPSDPAFMENVRCEVADQLSRLRNHPSLALLCGNNEVREGMRHWGWKSKYSPEVWQEMTIGYEKLFQKLLPESVARYAPHVDYIHGSPYDSNWGDLESLSRSDAHYWGMWFGEEDYTTFDHNAGRFASEYGLQSFPEMKTVRSFAPEADSLSLNHPLVAHRQRSPGGNERLRLYMERDYPKPKSFADFTYLSLLEQRDATGYAIRAVRRAYPYNAGSLYWQINDVWPTVSWSSVDYWGNHKALHYAVERAYRPTIVDLVERGDSLALCLVSDDPLLRGSVDVEVTWMRTDGSLLASPSHHTYRVTETPLSVQLTRLPKPRTSDTILAEMIVRNSNGQVVARQLYYNVRPRQMKLPRPRYLVEERLTERGLTVTITAETLIKDLFIESPWMGALYSDNFFDLLPGETKTIQISHPDVEKGGLTFHTINDLLRNEGK